MTIIYAVILFALMIFPHELGHFVVAKSVGVTVNEFAFGMGPALLQRQKGDTLYSIRLIPIGGYCAMEGENEDTGGKGSFNNKPVWAKLAVLFAGSGVNILIAVLALSILVGVVGSVTTTLDEIQPDSPAFSAGLREGDEILSIDGKKIETWNDITAAMGEGSGTRTIEIERDGSVLTLQAAPEKNAEGRYVIGIMPKISHNVFTAVENGAKLTWRMTGLMFDSLRMLVTGQVSSDEIAGPVGIVSMAGETSKYGVTYFVNLLALMSLNLAIINLLPLPALDGGRILFVIIRKLTGRMISDKLESSIHGIGMMLLFALMIFVTWNDITRLLT
ncbi:RIP metalloprotease RseP [Ihubacter sp. rT4E-8]|uniref:RIP metalloprotease RseP n=1 Tax=Ihubacter sp. rT4E-8 TaxID=3242369 RepID=UPI003CEFAB27